MADGMKSITVRLSPSHLRMLEARADRRGLRPAPYLRSLVVDMLESADVDDSEKTTESLTRAVDDLRHRLAKATAAILTDLQTTKEKKVERLSVEEINKWVGNNILR